MQSRTSIKPPIQTAHPINFCLLSEQSPGPVPDPASSASFSLLLVLAARPGAGIREGLQMRRQPTCVTSCFGFKCRPKGYYIYGIRRPFCGWPLHFWPWIIMALTSWPFDTAPTHAHMALSLSFESTALST